MSAIGVGQIEYVVVMRCSSGLYFDDSEPIPTMRFPATTGPIELTFGNSRIELPGLDEPVRAGIWADARGKADSIATAVEVWANFSRGVAALLSVVGNGPIGNLTAELAYDNSASKTKREYWRQSIPQFFPIPHSGRLVESRLAVEVIRAWISKPHAELLRWHRAMNAYHHALQEWEPGMEIPALGHLWIGMETLTPIALRAYLERHQISRDELQNQWRTESRNLEAEIRRRILFKGDEQCYRDAKGARNGHQHGFTNLWDVREKAVQVRDQCATYLREAILDLIGLDIETRIRLKGRHYFEPFHWTYQVQITGEIECSSGKFIREGDTYPRVDFWLEPFELGVDANGDTLFDNHVVIEPLLGYGATFHPMNLTVLKPQALESDSLGYERPGIVVE